jgi:hypothetical protein
MNGKQWFSSSSGRIELELDLDDAGSGYHQGRCDDDVAALRAVPYIKAQLDAIAPDVVRDELRGYGAWDDNDLADHDANLSRLLWLACGDIVDNPEEVV